MNPSSPNPKVRLGLYLLSVSLVVITVHGLEVPMESRDDRAHFLYSVPAPRGMILDRDGQTLAANRAAKRVVIHPAKIRAQYPKGDVVELVRSISGELAGAIPGVEIPEVDVIRRHLKHRPFFPLPLSEPLTSLGEKVAGCSIELYSDFASLQDIYVRVYPEGEPVSHLVGYVGRSAPDQHGPLESREPLWQPFEGRHGLELTMDTELTGRSGVISVLYDEDGSEIERMTVREPIAGKTVVTSINLKMQKLSLDLLKKAKRNGAFVAVDAETGDLLALSSNPGFDSNDFVPSISQTLFDQLSNNSDAPLFNRAVSAVYPPGSTFKPLVALAGLSANKYSQYTKFSGPPSMDVDGMTFRNWSKNHEGSFSVRYALVRSSNTWFYQAAFKTTDQPILDIGANFGLNTVPTIPLPGVEAGNLPSQAPSRRGLANLSIGQGTVLASPLQMALAMTGFANRDSIVEPRLVIQLQEPGSHAVSKGFSPVARKLIADVAHVDVVREGMWGVVNHAKGTGKSAKHYRYSVFGKTGTSQWTADGVEKRVALFTGFIEASNPRIAFAVVTEGREGESISGGTHAAPLAGTFLREVYKTPEDFLVSAPPGKNYSTPYIPSPSAVVRKSSASQRKPVRSVRWQRTSSSSRRGFFSSLFRRRR